MGKRIYSTKVDQQVVSLSISPTHQHLVAGLGSRRSNPPANTFSVGLIYKFIDNPIDDDGEKDTSYNTGNSETRSYYNISDPIDRRYNEFLYSFDSYLSNYISSPRSNRTSRNDDVKDNKKTMVLLRELQQTIPETTTGNFTVNCIRWAPQPGQGIVYATNTGLLNILH